MFRAPHDKYKRLPDEVAFAMDGFQDLTPPIQLKIFDKVPISNTYSSVPSYEPDTSDHPKRELHHELQSRPLAGWRAGAMLSASLASVSLLLNFSVAIWALKTFGTRSALIEVFSGDCKNVQKINTVIHLGINVMSTVLLSGSNYCMQCLSAPTRQEVDRAHAKGQWVDIGVPSVRNLRSISRKKVWLWWCLGLSSIPLHLMYVPENLVGCGDHSHTTDFG